VVDPTIVKAIETYLTLVRRAGIAASRAVLFGSYVRGTAVPESDVDILVVAPEFDGPPDQRYVNTLWMLRTRTDSRIEPFPVGERQWQEDEVSSIIEVARREGQEILAPSGA
jgi:predicted nucleotidyltransferase